jgi:hypothetical protein
LVIVRLDKRLAKATVAILGLCALAGIAALLLLGRADSTQAPIPAGSPIYVHPPHSATVGGVYVNDVTSNLVATPTVTLLKLPGLDRFQLRVTNNSGIGFIEGFAWYPPVGMQVLKILRTNSGRCVISGTTGIGGNQFSTAVLNQNIACSNVHLKPPSCTCNYDGGYSEVSFVVHGEPLNAGSTGFLRTTSMTPVLRVVPSQLQSAGATRHCARPLCAQHE